MRNAPSLTAQAVCWMRASEAHRRDPILRDSLAASFLPRIPRRLATSGIGPRGGLTNFVVGRHRFIDDHLEALGVPQCVLVGAGYDSRPWRMPSRKWFVVDHPATLARRQRQGPAHDGIHCAMDLSVGDLAAALETVGHDPALPTAWIWEGVSMYLGQSAIRNTLAAFHARSVQGSSLFADFWHPRDGPQWQDGLHRLSASALQLIGEPLRYGLHPADAQAVLASHGWSVVSHGTATHLERRFHRRFDPSMHVVRADWLAP